ncbi:MAG TPA: type II toxin-antitoxin system HicA family toxin [Kiloniellales bacterium]
MRSWTFRAMIKFLQSRGFELHKESGSSRTYSGIVNGQVRLVAIHFHRSGDDIKPGTLRSIIRQSGIPKKEFE